MICKKQDWDDILLACLARWNADGSRGCLGAEVRKAVKASASVRALLYTLPIPAEWFEQATEGSVGLDILQVDGLLT